MENTITNLTAFCVKCKEKRPIANPEEGTTKNNRRVLKGICSVCGTKLMRFLPAEIKPKEND